MANPIRDFFESMSGTSRQSYDPSLYDEKEMKRWKKKQNELYGTLDRTKERYDSQAGRFLDIYGESGKEADRYRGLAEGQIGRAGSSFDRATSSFGRSEADIARARGYQSSANALMGDREHYANLKRRAEDRRRGFESTRLGVDSVRGRLGRPAQDSGMTQRLLDAFKGANESSREIMEANTAELAKTNPVAAAKMQQEFNADTLKSIGQLKQQGMVSDQQLSDNNLTREAGLLMESANLYNQQAGQDQMLANIQQQQISNYGAAGTAALNAASAEGNLARGYLSQGSQYAGLGSQYAGMGSQLDARGANALNAGMRYEGMGYGALQDQTSIANKNVERQEKFRLSDAAARARVDSFNSQRANMGMQNTLGLIKTGAEIYGAVASGGMSSALTSSINAANAERQRRWDEKREQGDLESMHNMGGDDNINNGLPVARSVSYGGGSPSVGTGQSYVPTRVHPAHPPIAQNVTSPQPTFFPTLPQPLPPPSPYIREGTIPLNWDWKQRTGQSNIGKYSGGSGRGNTRLRGRNDPNYSNI